MKGGWGVGCESGRGLVEEKEGYLRERRAVLCCCARVWCTAGDKQHMTGMAKMVGPL